MLAVCDPPLGVAAKVMGGRHRTDLVLGEEADDQTTWTSSLMTTIPGGARDSWPSHGEGQWACTCSGGKSQRCVRSQHGAGFRDAAQAPGFRTWFAW